MPSTYKPLIRVSLENGGGVLDHRDVREECQIKAAILDLLKDTAWLAIGDVITIRERD